MTTNPRQDQETIAAAVLVTVVGLAALGALLDSAARTTGHPVVACLAIAALAVLIGVARWVAGRVRESREEAADALTAVVWRAEHMPHLAAQIDGARLDRDRAGMA